MDNTDANTKGILFAAINYMKMNKSVIRPACNVARDLIYLSVIDL